MKTLKRNLGCLAFAAALGVAAMLSAPTHSTAAESCLRLVNGRIHTMDSQNRVVSSLSISGNKFATIGRGGPIGRGCPVINLRGRTVVPGFIDNHNHIILLGLRPGNDLRLEKPKTIPEVIEAFAAKAAEVPSGEWITSLGGFNINQWTRPPADPRFPTRQELDQASTKHPIFMMQSFAGPGAANSLARKFFMDNGVAVGEDGSVVGFGNNTLAMFLLRQLPQHNTLEHQKRSLEDAMIHAASVGVTTHLDQGGFPFADSFFGNPGTPADLLASFDRYRAFDALQFLHREDRLINRFQVNFLHLENDPQTPELLNRLLNVFPFTGDEWLTVGGIGEFTAGAGAIVTPSAAWQNGTRLVAKHGWRNENHSLTPTDFMTIIEGWEQVNQELQTTGIDEVVNPDGITRLRWVVAHVPFITTEFIERAKALGVGLSVLGGWRWLSGTPGGNGPPFRRIIDSGIHVGMSSDGMQISVLDPFINMFYMITGKNARGVLINDGQQVSRQEAISLYTRENGWFLRMEDKIGTIEEGKYADLVVLSADFFDPVAVPDDAIVDLRSLLTIVNGRIVHGDPDDLRSSPRRRMGHR